MGLGNVLLYERGVYWILEYVNKSRSLHVSTRLDKRSDDIA